MTMQHRRSHAGETAYRAPRPRTQEGANARRAMHNGTLQGTEGAIAPLLLSALQSAKVGVALKDPAGRYM